MGAAAPDSAPQLQNVELRLLARPRQRQAVVVSANAFEHADLIALARELLYNPNWPMDATQKLGVDAKFASVPSAQAYWLAKRAQSVKSVVPSTYMKGLRVD